MPRHPIALVLLVAFFPLSACDGATEPSLEPANVNVLMNASVVHGDSGVLVNGDWRVRHPSNDEALWLDRFFHHESGGFPELDYPQNTRWSDTWRLMLTHQKEELERNDSTIFSYVDHGDASVEGSAMDKLTDLPGVGPGTRVGFENYVRYLTTAWGQVVWTGGGETIFHDADYHPAMLRGEPIAVATTGSDETEPVATTFQAFRTATLEGVENDGEISFDADSPPVLRTDQPVVFEFDVPLDPDHAYIIFLPFGGDPGAKRAFMEPVAATERVVISPSTLADLVQDSPNERVAYRVVIEEIRFRDDVFTGTFTDGASFSLPFVQESETVLHLYLEHDQE